MSAKQRQKIYNGDEARQLFEALYFTEPATSDSDHDNTQRAAGPAAGGRLASATQRGSEPVSTDSSDTDSEPSFDGSTSSSSSGSRTRTNNYSQHDGKGFAGVEDEVSFEVPHVNSYTQSKQACHQADDRPLTSEADVEADETDSGDCLFTEVDLSMSELDCYISEVDVTFKEPDETDSGDCSFTEVDLSMSELDCYISEVDVTFKEPEDETLETNQDGREGVGVDVFTEVDMSMDTEDSDPDTDTWRNEDEGGAISEVDLNNATGSDPDTDTWRNDEGGATSEVDVNNATAVRGRKRTRVHFIDSNSDSSCISVASSCAKRRKKNKSSRELSSILRMKCCRNYYLHKVSRKEVSYSRNAFQEKSKCEQRQWILQYLLEHHEESGNTVQVLFSIGATEVCQRGWRLALGISRTRLWQIQSHFQNGLKAYLPPNHHRRGMQSTAVASAMMWLERFSHRFGDKLPTQNKVHLPSCLTRASIYHLMREDMDDLGEQVCSKVHFFRMWRKEMSHVTIPKVNRFSKCDVCTELKQRIEKTNEKEARQALHQQREGHLTQQKMERMKYYKHIQKARKYPEKYMSVIIDGMDQKSTSVPKFYRTSKSVAAAWRLPTHITGTIVHGRGQHIFIDTKEYPHDSNLTSTILLQVLLRYSTTLPDTLYLQMDNCGRENKNQCILALCALLVELNVFKKVKLCFLMKGHTHEDIDQLFSRISTHMSKHNIPTLSSLLFHIPKSYNKPNTTAERIHTIFNVRDWLQTHINKPSHHSLPHQFKITKVDGKAIIQTKKWSNSPEWQATTGSSHILSGHPSGVPHVVHRKVEELCITRLYRDMAKYRPYLSESEHQEWMELLSSLEAEDDGSHPHWILLDILMAKDANSTDQPRDPRLDINLSSDEQDPIPPVNLGRKIGQRRPPQIGHMVCVFLESFRNEWPQVGKITTLHEHTAVVHWFTGTTTSSWTALNKPTRRKGLSEPYISTIPKSSFITGSFNLTGHGKLPQEIQRQLREKREELYNQ